MSTHASSSMLHPALDGEEEDDIDAAFTDDDAEIVSSADDDDDDDDDEEDMEEKEDVSEDVEEDDTLDEISDLPTQDDEDAVTALLAKMNAKLASTKPAASDSNEEESDQDVEEDTMHIDVLCPISDLSKKEKEVLKKAKTVHIYDPSQKGGCRKPIAKKKKRVPSSAPANVQNPTSGKSYKRTLSTSPILLRKDPKTAFLQHQTDAIQKLTELLDNGSGCLLAHAPGWGKTLSTLGILSTMQDKDKSKSMTAIVLYPLTLSSVWRSELEKWDFPNLEIWVSFETKKEIDNFIDAGIPSWNTPAKPGVTRLIMTTHDLFVHAIDADLKSSLASAHVRVDFLVIDEVHTFKNDATKKHTKIIQSRDNDFCGRIIGLTGTPVQNNVAELYGLLNLIQRDYFGSLTKKEVMKLIGLNCKSSSLDIVMLKNDTLYKKLVDIMHRQDDTSVLHSLLTSEDYAICFDAGFATDSFLQPSKPALQAREEMLQQSKDERLDIVKMGIETCIEINEPLLVFSERKEFLETLHKQFQGSLILTGDTSNSMRAKLVKEFQDNVSIKVFFLSIKAAGMGITLTRATHVFICDACWNPTYETQAIARALRIGQTKTVKVYRFLAQSSIEIMIARDGPNKLGAANRIVDDKPLSSIFTQEQLQEKNPQYIVDPDDEKFKVSDAVTVANRILVQLSFYPGLKVFNYANLIHTVIKNHSEKTGWFDIQNLTETGYKRLESFVFERLNDPLFTPVVKRHMTISDKLSFQFGPWKHETCEDAKGIVRYVLELKVQIALGDDKEFIKTNPNWIDLHHDIDHRKPNILIFDIDTLDDSKYMAIRVQAKLANMDKELGWSDPSAVFKKSFFD